MLQSVAEILERCPQCGAESKGKGDIVYVDRNQKIGDLESLGTLADASGEHLSCYNCGGDIDDDQIIEKIKSLFWRESRSVE